MRSIRNWLPALAALGAILILVLSLVASQRIAAVHRQAVAAQLRAQLETLTSLLEVMQHNFLEASRTVSYAPELIALTRNLADHPGDVAARTELETWTRNHLSTFGFSQYSIFDPGLTIVAAHDPVYIGAKSNRLAFFAQLDKDDFAVSFPFRTRRTTAASAAAGRRDYIQLACHTIRGDARLLGYLCIGSDPRQLLFPLLQGGWAGRSGEAYLIDHDARLRTPSRFESAFAGDPEPVDELQVSRLYARVTAAPPTPGQPLPVPDANAPPTRLAQALLDEPVRAIRSFDDYTDQRGRQVVGVGTWMPEFDLGLIVEMDEGEVYQSAELANRWLWALALTAVAILILLAVKDKRARRDLAVREAQLSSFFANAPMSMHIQDANGDFLRANPEFERMRKRMEHADADSAAARWRRMRDGQRAQVLESGEVLRHQGSFSDLDGFEVHVAVVRFPIRLEGSDENLGVGTIGVEVTAEVEARRQLEQLAARLESDVAHRTAELRTARDAAEAAMRAKAEFLANMSHEIRTPLNAISGMSHLAVRANADPKIGHYLDRIESAGAHLLAIVNDILDFSKMEAEKFQLTLAAFSPQQVLDDVVALTAPRIGNRDLDLLVTVEPGVPAMVVGDAMRIGQVLINFAANAIKFTEDGTVEIRLSCGGRQDSNAILRFEVEDTGRGIPPDQLALLFQPFTQLDGTRRRAHEGTGLGLAICKKLAEHMGGAVSAASTPGKGSTFTLEIPLAVASGAVVPATVPMLPRGARALVVDDHERAGRHTVGLLRRIGVDAVLVPSIAAAATQHAGAGARPFAYVLVDARCDRAGQATRSLAAGPAAAALRVLLLPPGTEPPDHAGGYDAWVHKPLVESMLVQVLGPAAPQAPGKQAARGSASTSLEGLRVLLVEDNEVNREVATDLLATRGVVVEVACDGMQALQAVDKGRFDLILMDIHMPVFDGIQTTRALRADASLHDLPIVGLSASVLPADQSRALAAGMNAFVTKPIVPQELFAALERWGAPQGSVGGDRAKPIVPAGDADADVALVAHLQAGSGLDTAQGIALLLGRIDLYAKLVRRVVGDNACASTKLVAAIIDGDMATATRIAHNLGSIAGSLGAAGLRRECIAMEGELRAGESSQARMARVVESLDKLNRALAAAVAAGAAYAAPEAKTMPG